MARASTDDLSSSEDEYAITADTIAWNATHMKALRQRIQKVGGDSASSFLLAPARVAVAHKRRCSSVAGRLAALYYII